MAEPKGEVKRVADHVMAHILSGQYPCGLRLPSEAALAEQLDVGRSTVREALRHLATMGLVQSRRGSGAMVLDYRREGTPALLPAFVMSGSFDVPPGRMARELLRLRRMMAAEAVRLAASYGTAEGLRAARARLAEAPALEDDPAAHALNELSLYRELVFASGLWPAAWMVNAFWGPLREVNAMFAAALGPVPPQFQETMTELLDLIEQRDEEAAVTRVHSWFERVDRRVVRLIERMFHASGQDTPTLLSAAAQAAQQSSRPPKSKPKSKSKPTP